MTVVNGVNTQDRTQSVSFSMQGGYQDLDKSNSETVIDSKQVLQYVEKYYKERRRNLGTLRYDALRQGRFDGDSGHISLPFPYDFRCREMPEPFIPRLGNGAINGLLSVLVKPEDLVAALERDENARVYNRELWGTDIYTCDSDPLLVLVHCGALGIDGSGVQRRTPANLANPDCVSTQLQKTDGDTGLDTRGLSGFDIILQLLFLPPLQSYFSSTRFGIQSRNWNTLHDGLSYGIYSIEIITSGVCENGDVK